MNNSTKKIHLIACGGAVMHNLALALHKKGFEITGSDDEIYDPAKTRLANAGILPEANGWYPEKITNDLDAIILGMHARADNPELLKAQALGLKIYSFPEYIYEQSLDKQRIVIAGSHGKTSITSIILHVLKFHKRKFDYLVGAGIEGFDLWIELSNDAPVIIIEGDEYLASALKQKSKFLFYHAHIALISGIAWDHFNVFPEFENYVQTFEELADNLPKAGAIIYDETDDVLKVIGDKDRPDISKEPYVAHPYKIIDGKAFLLTPNGDVPLEIFGEHNMKNLQGAKLVLGRVGINDEMFYSAIRTFKGASKRLEKLGESRNTLIFRDFAHAPSKLAATTQAAKDLYDDRRLIACYELHTFSSLNKTFLPQYADKIQAADVAVVFFSPHTLEMKKMPALTVDDIKKAFGQEDLMVFTDKQDLEAFLLSQNYYKTNLLMMSSGTFGGLDLAKFAIEILKLPVVKTTYDLKKPQKKKKTWGNLLGKFKKNIS